MCEWGERVGVWMCVCGGGGGCMWAWRVAAAPAAAQASKHTHPRASCARMQRTQRARTCSGVPQVSGLDGKNRKLLSVSMPARACVRVVCVWGGDAWAGVSGLDGKHVGREAARSAAGSGRRRGMRRGGTMWGGRLGGKVWRASRSSGLVCVWGGGAEAPSGGAHPRPRGPAAFDRAGRASSQTQPARQPR